MSLNELLHYLRLGGVTLALLIFASVVALGVAIERLIALWGVSERSRTLGETVHKHLLRGDVAAMLAMQESVFGTGRGPSVDSSLAALEAGDTGCGGWTYLGRCSGRVERA